MLIEILEFLDKLLRKLFGPTVAALLILLFIRFVLPNLPEVIAGITLGTWGFILVVALIVIFILIWIFDTGSTSGVGAAP